VDLYPSRDHDLWVAKPSPSHAYDPALTSLGHAIRSRRAKVGLSQEALALQSGLDRSYLGGVERGEHNLALVNLIKISSALKVSASDLLQMAKL
jgi:transcriptional regulator with XRE-family HTH domain